MNAILFDLDGTLWDACEVLTVCWNRTLSEKFPDLGVTLTLRDIQGAMGKTLDEIARLFFPHAPIERAREAVATVAEDELPTLAAEGGRLYEGLADTLETLSRTHTLGIVSNCQCGYIEAFLQAHGLAHYFTDFLCEGMTKQTKGDNIRALVEKHGFPRAVYIGDTQSDEDAARAAGLPFIHAAYGFGRAAAPDAVIYSPRELPAVVARFA